jgi:hypothetical protein
MDSFVPAQNTLPRSMRYADHLETPIHELKYVPLVRDVDRNRLHAHVACFRSTIDLFCDSPAIQTAEESQMTEPALHPAATQIFRFSGRGRLVNINAFVGVASLN